MANLMNSMLYGNNSEEFIKGVAGFSLQFHITAKCDQACKHCYMYNSPYYKSQIENDLSLEQKIQLLDEYFSFLAEYDSFGLVAITGGDPILSPHFWNILQHIQENYQDKCTVVVMGNPYHITKETARKMKSLGVSSYQISLDGLEKTHDFLRKPGSFEKSIYALKVLHGEGVYTVVSFTVSKLNKDELLPLYDYLQNLPYVDMFGFDRMVPTGNGENISREIFSGSEYRQFLFEVLKHEVLKNYNLVIEKKEEMWKALLYELGLASPIDTRRKKQFLTGCHCGTGTISVLADGTVFPCRKLELSAGKYPQKSLKDIFINNDVTKMFRKYQEYKGCSTCSNNVICRGCPAMKYAVTKDFYDYEPYCWRCPSDEKPDLCD